MQYIGLAVCRPIPHLDRHKPRKIGTRWYRCQPNTQAYYGTQFQSPHATKQATTSSHPQRFIDPVSTSCRPLSMSLWFYGNQGLANLPFSTGFWEKLMTPKICHHNLIATFPHSGQNIEFAAGWHHLQVLSLMSCSSNKGHEFQRSWARTRYDTQFVWMTSSEIPGKSPTKV